MGNFNRGGGGGGFRPRNQDVQRYKAVCKNCGQNCEVPFRPTGERPVYCNNCFGKMRNSGGGGSAGSDNRAPQRDFDRQPRGMEFNRDGGNAGIVRQLEEANTKLDRIIRALERPMQVAPVPQVIRPAGTLKQAVKKAIDSKKKK